MPAQPVDATDRHMEDFFKQVTEIKVYGIHMCFYRPALSSEQPTRNTADLAVIGAIGPDQEEPGKAVDIT